MRIAIIGIGGVGGYFGGKLARTYASSGKHEIIFIARGEHLKVIQREGLRIMTEEGDYTVWPNIATDQPDIAGPFDIALFCVKSYALESTAHYWKGNILHATVVIPLLNGVESADRLRLVLPHADVISGSVLIISHIENPGTIHQEGGACKLTFGTDDVESSKKYKYIFDIFREANIKVDLTDKISEVLWRKMLLMSPMASLMSSTGKTFGEIWQDVSLRNLAKQLIREVFEVARARHILLPPDSIEQTLETIAALKPEAKTSMQWDMEKGKQTEIDIFTAFLCKTGKQLGVPTPLHDDLLKSLSEKIKKRISI
jgi:2-dehydropantoate 2-reductase